MEDKMAVGAFGVLGIMHISIETQPHHPRTGWGFASGGGGGGGVLEAKLCETSTPVEKKSPK